MLMTNNEGWGFFGTISQHADAEAAWREAFIRIAEATACSAESIRDFLDSRHGRHFADDVANGLAAGLDVAAATAAAVDRWQTWRIGRRTARDEGIPAGLPYLTGRVAQFEVMNDAA